MDISDCYLEYMNALDTSIDYLYMMGMNSSLQISCSSERKMTCVDFYLYSCDGEYYGFQYTSCGNGSYTGTTLEWDSSGFEWYASDAGFTSLNLSCGNSNNSPCITKIVVTYQVDTPDTDPIQSQSATATKTEWATGPVKFHFKDKGAVTLTGDTIDKVIDKLYGSGTWSKLGDSSLSMTFQFSGIPSGEVFQSVTVGQQ